MQVTSDHALRLESSPNPEADQWGDTASSIVVSTNSVGDFDETVRLRTLAQLRNEAVPAGSRGEPNGWEVAWFGWHFIKSGDDVAYYYVILKPNGFEFAKVDQRPKNPDGSYVLEGGQRYLVTATTQFPIGVWYTLRIRQIGAAMTVWVDDQEMASFTDGPGSLDWHQQETILKQGAWVYYHEDARVEFDDGPYVPKP